MPEKRKKRGRALETKGVGSSQSVNSGDLFSSSLSRRAVTVGGDQTDLGVTRETGELYPERASIVDNIFALLSIGTFLADIAMDVVVAWQYYHTRHYWWFGLTVTFIVFPCIVLQIFSCKWYREDEKVQSIGSYGIHLFLLGPIERYLNAFYYGCKTYGNTDVNPSHYHEYVTEWRDVTMLRLFEAFLEAGPQVVLQLYVLITLNVFIPERDWQTAMAAITSVVSIAWAIVSYSHALRLCYSNKGLSWSGYIFQMWYRMCMVASRVVTLVLFASVYKEWIFLFVSVHFAFTFIWLSLEKSSFCPHDNNICQKMLEKLFNIVIAIIYIFCFFNIHEGATRYRVLFYYLVFCLENLLLAVLWFPKRTIHGGLMYASLGVIVGGFVLGVIFMLLYHKYFHPSQDITEGWLPCTCCCRKESEEPRKSSVASDHTVGSFDRDELNNIDQRQIGVPKPLKLKARQLNWRRSLLADSPGTPIDVELPFRFGSQVNTDTSRPTSLYKEVSYEDPINMDQESRSGKKARHFKGGPDSGEIGQNPGGKSLLKKETASDGNETYSPPNYGYIGSVNGDLDVHIYPSTTNVEHSPVAQHRNCGQRIKAPNKYIPLKSIQTDDSLSATTESSLLCHENMTSGLTNYGVKDDILYKNTSRSPHLSPYEFISMSETGEAFDDDSVGHSETRSNQCFNSAPCCCDSIPCRCPSWEEEYHKVAVKHLMNMREERMPYSDHRKSLPLNSGNDIHSGHAYDESSPVESPSEHDIVSSSEDEKSPLEFSNICQSRGRSRSLPSKAAIRQSVVDWVAGRIKTERLKDVVQRPHSDLGTYTVTVNIKGNDYYTSLV